MSEYDDYDYRDDEEDEIRAREQARREEEQHRREIEQKQKLCKKNEKEINRLYELAQHLEAGQLFSFVNASAFEDMKKHIASIARLNSPNVSYRELQNMEKQIHSLHNDIESLEERR